MTDSRTVTAWDLLTMVLWSALFGVGLVPELAFHTIRGFAGVSSSGSLVNSSSTITLGFAIYVSLFVLRQCKAAGLEQINAQGRAVQAALWSLIAFLEIPTRSPIFGTQTLLGILWESPSLPSLELKAVIWAVGFCKLIAWSYLYSLMFRFHVLGNRDAFNGIRLIVPARHDKANSEQPEPISTENSDESPSSK
ncbi:MAG: hypothetical protein VCD00_04035 [Candidatus Hydrogenedentota bacterium]